MTTKPISPSFPCCPSWAAKASVRSLLDEAIHWAQGQGLEGVTLTTFRDVPWNAPFYSSVGFVEVVDPALGLAAIRRDEQERGADAMGRRLAMRMAL